METTFNWLRFREEIADYKYLIENFMEADITDDKDAHGAVKSFQSKFNSYFHNGLTSMGIGLGEEALKKHYELLETYKDLPTPPSFEDALRNFYVQTGRIIPFFASQVAHFFNPDMPICSKFACNGLGIKVTTKEIEQACKDYDNLTKRIHEFRDSAQGQEIIESFRKTFNERINRNISATKIIDFYFWFSEKSKGK